MNTPGTPGRRQSDRVRAADAARNEIRRAVHAIARDSGSPMISRLAFRGSHAIIPDAESLAGMQIARDLELAARSAAHDYIRAAREAGHSWHDIGTALQLTPDADAQQTGDTIAEAAYTYAAGNPDSDIARLYGRSVVWTCPNCDHAISDRGLGNGSPADDEHGHDPDCPRLAATIAIWDAAWEEAELEAGE